MLTSLVQKLITIVTTLAMIIAGQVLPAIQDTQEELAQLQVDQMSQQMSFQSAQEPRFGTFYAVGGGRYYLAGSGISSSATSIVLRSLTEPISGLEIGMTAFGSTGFATIEPGSSNKKEFISFTGITQNANNTEATLTGVSRGLGFRYPYTASTTLASAHSGGSVLIFSNAPAFYGQFAIKANTESITGTWTFDDDAWPKIDASGASPSEDGEFATKKYADDIANAGAADAATTTAGIVEIADTDELIHFTTTTGTSDRLLVPYIKYFATSTDKRGATTTMCMTDSDGKLDQSFYNLAEEWDFTATTTHASSTYSGGLRVTERITAEKIAITASSTLATTTMTDMLFLPSRDPTNDDQATRKYYVDNIPTKTGSRLLNASSTDNISFGYASSTAEIPIMNITVPANTFSTSSAIEFQIYVEQFGVSASDGGDNDSAYFKLDYGGTDLVSLTVNPANNITKAAGDSGNGFIINGEIHATGATNSQRAMMGFVLSDDSNIPGTYFGEGSSAIDSTNAQTLQVTVSWSTARQDNGITVLGSISKIIIQRKFQ